MSDEPWHQGGEPACMLHLVCPACGRVRERPGSAVCEHCGVRLAEETVALGDETGGRARDRDSAGRARNARPRDGLGRPLPYGAEGVTRQPEGVIRSPEETLREAQRLLDAGMPFHAHEVLEDRWKASPDDERALWRALAQLAVGLTHAARGNAKGASALLSRAADGLDPYAGASPYGVDAAALVTWARARTGGRDGILPPPPLHRR
ncbi:DUF309 domain-containing protein [Streptomyces sp. MI02-7b]|nr:DUF309 domain-containing protein [Streptomyces sp. MI02-7b]MDX3075415.1 DUF309 domain-containing protein [Streptomyces sp. MI02-7b]